MNTEQAVKEIEDYLTSVEWTESKRQRILAILRNVSTKEVVITNEVIKVVRYVAQKKKDDQPLDYTNTRLDALAKAVCDKHGITREYLRSRNRHNELVAIRLEFYELAFNEMQASFCEIARYVNKHHATIMHSLGRLKQKPKFKRIGF